ncbi:hypothetical protein [Legionella parisiensis]|uniref:Uncharacterized protein n=1 Tax=Legionella parisiensis TaxID=45071 RepID=A0A1E5JUN5_9GAMM|nr:hypothetical protein [Legionella parisiensis]KTD43159.1 hypothetical protein Lpar_1136 [Legionella parisiensis]OEH48242.1 hypothetical protein lpari_00734 [Legionella parisiensis]STX77760.1 Uncharacterised protein [Legionella parisiensis]
MLTKIDVVMDSGGSIAEAGSQEEHVTDGFGGCTAFHVKTDSGLYGLYHLSGTSNRKPQMLDDAKDTNQPFRKWIKDLALIVQERDADQTLHFELGTPWLFGNQEKTRESHPQVGMERYLRGLCAKYGIKNYDITLINMIGVQSIAVSEKGMTCYDFNEKETRVCPAKYQTDEEILEHLGWTNATCLRYVTANNNIDFDGKLQKKYTERCQTEHMGKIKKEMEIHRKEMETNPKSVVEQTMELLKERKISLLTDIKGTLDKYQSVFESGPKEDKSAFHAFLFVEDLYKAVESDDLDSLTTLKTLPYFKQVTESTSILSFFSSEKTEIGAFFEKAEEHLIQMQKLLTETAQYSPTTGTAKCS